MEIGIQDGGHKTGSTNDVAGFPDTRVAPTIVSVRLCTKHSNLQRCWPTPLYVENPRWRLPNRK